MPINSLHSFAKYRVDHELVEIFFKVTAGSHPDRGVKVNIPLHPGHLLKLYHSMNTAQDESMGQSLI